jgi:hypothetical protein
MTDPRLVGRVAKVSGRANRSWLPPAPARVTISRRDADGNARRSRRSRRQYREVISGGAAAAEPGRSILDSGLAVLSQVGQPGSRQSVL